jgi:hypothetical protein
LAYLATAAACSLPLTEKKRSLFLLLHLSLFCVTSNSSLRSRLFVLVLSISFFLFFPIFFPCSLSPFFFSFFLPSALDMSAREGITWCQWKTVFICLSSSSFLFFCPLLKHGPRLRHCRWRARHCGFGAPRTLGLALWCGATWSLASCSWRKRRWQKLPARYLWCGINTFFFFHPFFFFARATLIVLSVRHLSHLPLSFSLLFFFLSSILLFFLF